MKQIIISIFNSKGGVCKSTTSAALGCNLARLGSSVTLIDGDPQGNIATLLRLGLPEDVITTREAILRSYGELWPAYYIGNGKINLNFTPSNYALGNIEKDVRQIGEEIVDLIRRKLSFIRTEYSVINLSSTFCHLNRAFIAASDFVVIPTLSEPLSLAPVANTAAFVDEVANNITKHMDGTRTPQVLGILICRDENHKINQEAKAVLRETYPNLVFETVIPKTVQMENEALRGMLKDPLARNTAAASYLDFTNEVIARINLL